MDTGRGLTEQNWSIFGKRLKDELVKQGISYRQFADKAGLTLTTVYRYVNSLRTPRATEIIKSAEVLGVTCDYMLGLSDDPHKTRDGLTKASFHESPSAQPVAKDTNVPINVNDCISRQAAIDALDKHLQTTDVPVSYPGIISALTEWLNEVPSAQPERRPMLYRDRVMLAKNFEEWARENHVIDCPEAIICYLDIIGLIQPERKTGRWIDRNDNAATCSVCGKRWGLYRLLNYCPNCGERMDDGE